MIKFYKILQDTYHRLLSHLNNTIILVDQHDFVTSMLHYGIRKI